MRVREYIVALWADWLALMSGIASVVLAFCAAFFPPANVQAGRTLLFVAAVLCLAFASYRMWARQQSEIDKLTAHKLTFEIDAPRSKVTVNGDIDEFNVVLHLYICFHNADIMRRTVRSVSVLLMKRNADKTESEIPLTEQKLYTVLVEHDQRVEHSWGNRNISVEAGELTLYHTIQGHMAVSDDYRKILNANCFLRVAVQATSQKLSTLDFNVKWEDINLGWIGITPRM
jgi:hypothetical protein